MAEEKYISKVRIGSENFVIRDKAALAAAQAAQATADAAKSTAESISVPVNGVTDDITFKDNNGKMYKLSLVDKKVKLVAVTYNAPSISISNFRWNSSDKTSYDVDQPSTGSVNGAVVGTITVTNGKKPTCNIPTVSISGESSPYTIGGTATVNNNGSLEIKFTTTGTMADPSTGVTANPAAAKTVSRTSTVASGWTVNAAAVQPESNTTGGFKFNINSTEVTPKSASFGNNSTVTLTPDTSGYIYIFTNAAKSFVMSTDKATVDSAKLGGGIVDLTAVATYTIRKSYYVYRSLRPCTANTNVYVKAIV